MNFLERHESYKIKEELEEAGYENNAFLSKKVAQTIRPARENENGKYKKNSILGTTTNGFTEFGKMALARSARNNRAWSLRQMRKKMQNDPTISKETYHNTIKSELEKQRAVKPLNTKEYAGEVAKESAKDVWNLSKAAVTMPVGFGAKVLRNNGTIDNNRYLSIKNGLENGKIQNISVPGLLAGTAGLGLVLSSLSGDDSPEQEETVEPTNTETQDIYDYSKNIGIAAAGLGAGMGLYGLGTYFANRNKNQGSSQIPF